VLGVWILNCACFLYISLFYVCLSCIVFRVSTFVVNKHLHIAGEVITSTLLCNQQTLTIMITAKYAP